MIRARTLSRRVHLFGALVFVLVPVGAACGGKIDGQNGGAGAGPSASATGTGSPTSTATTTPSPASSLCDSNGQSTQDAGTCSVSFTQTIFELYMAPQGEWACSNASCHGPSGSGGTATNTPTIDAYDAHAAYVSLTQLQFGGAPYINACSTDPNASSFTCNLLGGACGPTMPEDGNGASPTLPPSEHSIADLKTWLACGAPFN